jgi:hypothetical protein
MLYLLVDIYERYDSMVPVLPSEACVWVRRYYLEKIFLNRYSRNNTVFKC